MSGEAGNSNNGWTGIGRLAKSAGISVSALRFYDQIGLLPCKGRGQGGVRFYRAGDLAKLKSIARLQAMGFGLTELVRLKKSKRGWRRRRRLFLRALRQRLSREIEVRRVAGAKIRLLKQAIKSRSGSGQEWSDGLAAFIRNGG